MNLISYLCPDVHGDCKKSTVYLVYVYFTTGHLQYIAPSGHLLPPVFLTFEGKFQWNFFSLPYTCPVLSPGIVSSIFLSNIFFSPSFLEAVWVRKPPLFSYAIDLSSRTRWILGCMLKNGVDICIYSSYIVAWLLFLSEGFELIPASGVPQAIISYAVIKSLT